MARAKEEPSLWGMLASTEQYKRSQGRLIRQVTGLALAGIVLFGCYTMTQTVLSSPPDFLLSQADSAATGDELPPPTFWEANWGNVRYGVPALLGALGVWGIFRLLNYPRFTDFLISVEGEMDKVSWASQTYLIRATGVVLGTMLVLGAYLWLCDLVWSWLFRFVGFLRLTI